MTPTPIYFNDNASLSFNKSNSLNSSHKLCGDPLKPVPYTEDVLEGRTREYMTDDQRFCKQKNGCDYFKLLFWKTI